MQMVTKSMMKIPMMMMMMMAMVWTILRGDNEHDDGDEVTIAIPISALHIARS